MANKGKLHSEEHNRKIGLASKGRTASKETRQKMSIINRQRATNPEYIQKLSDAAKRREKIECPHCGKMCSINTAKQWHFDNCKHK